MAALFAFLHHVAAFTLVGAIAVEFVLIRDPITAARARQLLFTDLLVGISAVAVLVIGLFRVFWFEKGVSYYLHSIPFIAKFLLFVTVAAISLVPTVEFLSWRGAVNKGQAPVVSEQKLRSIRLVLHLELAGIAVLLLCAALMAKGVGIV